MRNVSLLMMVCLASCADPLPATSASQQNAVCLTCGGDGGDGYEVPPTDPEVAPWEDAVLQQSGTDVARSRCIFGGLHPVCCSLFDGDHSYAGVCCQGSVYTISCGIVGDVYAYLFGG